ncbi:TonB-dependent receptor [Echinicola sp. 20G]|uniref:SusC/RagA family TonB-linked outer membrane protein n=1 Tax=Echinicola sp. 20G TaxID=2781961 RepID=UPI0019104429|nr:TonB-dependent receptor [Echinicola sp. 20G]
MKHFYTKRLILLICLIINYSLSYGQSTKITGTVYDENGVGLPGASVQLKGTGTGTATNVEGEFELLVPDKKSVLVFSFVGYQTQEVLVGTKTSIDIHMEMDSDLEEVVVTAYGEKQKKEAIVGSVASVQVEDLKIPSSNLTTSLAGQVAGVIAYQSSGQPGQDNANFFIRGVTTFGYKKDPLILIDNVELTATDLARLQVDDIASFSILKDASATALYGARGANGVILVSTKEGKVGKPKINVRFENSISQNVKSIDLAGPITYMNLENEATVTRDPLALPPHSQTKIINTKKTIENSPGSNRFVYPAVDWLDMLFKPRTSTQRLNMNVSGGGGVARYYVAASYNLDNGILKQDDRNNNDSNIKFQNYQLRSNINIDLTESTELVLRLSGTFNEYNGPLSANGSFATDLYNIAMHTSPVEFPAYYLPDSANLNTNHILFGNKGGNNQILYNNPYALLLRGHKNSSQSRMSAQLELNQEFDFITEGLSFRGIFNTNRYSFFESQMAYSPFYYNISTYDAQQDIYSLEWLNPNPIGNNVATEYLQYSPGPTSLNTYVYLQGALDYSRKFGESQVSSTLIGTRQQTLYANASELQNALPYRNLTFAGRGTYSFKSKYFAEVNFGYNGSERFDKSHRFGFFPTGGVGWVVSEERFFDPFKSFIDFMKLRASYGLVGNDAIGSQRFFYLSNVGFNQGPNFASFGTDNGYTRNGIQINNYANPNITWETSRQTNLAMELTLASNLDITAEFYKQYRYNILMGRSAIPSTMGLESQISANVGSVKSKGIDLNVDYKQNFASGAWASMRGNFTYATNKYDHYEEPQWEEDYRYLSGRQPVNWAIGYVAERLFVDDEEAANSPTQIFSTNGEAPKGGDIKYKDMNNDGIINHADQVFLGFPTVPEIVYGFGFSSGFKNFDLSVFFQGQSRVSFFIDPRRMSPFIPGPDQYVIGDSQLLQEWADSHWSEDNQDLYAAYPRFGTNIQDIENNLQASSWWLRDGSFLRLKSLEIGYTLPKSLLDKAYLSNCRFYFNGLNLFTFSHFDLWDPELGGNGFAYPIQKVFNVGVNVSL